MLFKTLAAILFLTSAVALASPVPTDTPDADATVDGIPNSILTVLETAIPDSWYSEIEDPASRSIIISQIEAGTYPAWYNALPSSVKAWASSDDNFAVNFAAVTTATDDGTSATENASPATTSAADTAATTATETKAVAGGSVTSGSASASRAASASKTAAASTHPSTATSTGGAAVATAGVAMSFAGVAGLLGLAIAL
ncbi:hypothetical protein N7454_008696 [Penicillium verhagenii]|nr:hypothetical protein N7454_008696 [Penicillium verhagenii]